MLVAGIDSSTQATKVVVRDALTGRLVRSGRAGHPGGTEVDPLRWWRALESAVAQAGGLHDVTAVSVAAQQHGLVCLDEDGQVLREALLWHDTRSAGAAAQLVRELGAQRWAEAVGTVPLAALTVAKLRWLAAEEPEVAARVAAVCLPHDWLTWKLGGAGALTTLTTDRGDASGTGYWSPGQERYRLDLLAQAFGRRVLVPRVLGPAEAHGESPQGPVIGPGTGDNMAAALGLGAGPGDLVVSVGTSGVVAAPSERPSCDPSGMVAGFADASGRYLPLVCTLNAATVLEAAARMLGVDLEGLSDLALAAPDGADGLVLLPYLNGERTPNLPGATGTLLGLTEVNTTPAHLARAAVEGVLCGLQQGAEALAAHLGSPAGRILLVGGGARSEALRRIAPSIFGHPVTVPEPAEYVAEGAARQAAWCVLGGPQPPPAQVATAAVYHPEGPSAALERYRLAAGEAAGR